MTMVPSGVVNPLENDGLALPHSYMIVPQMLDICENHDLALCV